MNEVNPVKSFNYSGRVKKHYIRTPPFTILILILTSWDYRMSTPSVSGHHVVHILMMITNSTKNSKLCKKSSGARNHYTLKKQKQTNITGVFTFSRPKLKIAPELLTKFPLGKLWLHLTLLSGFPYAFGSKYRTKQKTELEWEIETGISIQYLSSFIFIFVNFKKRKHSYPKILPQQL